MAVLLTSPYTGTAIDASTLQGEARLLLRIWDGPTRDAAIRVYDVLTVKARIEELSEGGVRRGS